MGPFCDGWPRRPIIYEINTLVWLSDLSRRYHRPVTLADVPDEEWKAVASLHVDAVWLMGVWERSPEGARIARTSVSLKPGLERVLPGYAPNDIVSSAYCVRRYVADERLGGPGGLARARQRLREHGLRLILDFVPNHLAPDHPWTREHPEYFVTGSKEDLSRFPDHFFEIDGVAIARGRDPNYPPWPDVAQVNAFHPGLRLAAAQTLSDIANQCDGVRCDMAMLMIGDVFARTWGDRAGARPQEEYWQEVILAVRREHPGFLFLAEAYWDLERPLLGLGFDYCYDKGLFDWMRQANAGGIRLHITAGGPDYQDCLVRFIENHDEERVAAAFSSQKERAAAVLIMTLSGARLLHEGQMEGRRVRASVFLTRRQDEPVDLDLQSFYHKLLAAVRESGLSLAEWRLCECTGWPDNQSCANLLAWCWQRDKMDQLNQSNQSDRTCYLVAINWSDGPSQGRVRFPWSDLAERRWRLIDLLSGDLFERSGDEIHSEGLFVDLPAWRFHLLRIVPG